MFSLGSSLNTNLLPQLYKLVGGIQLKNILISSVLAPSTNALQPEADPRATSVGPRSTTIRHTTQKPDNSLEQAQGQVELFAYAEKTRLAIPRLSILVSEG